MVDDYWGPSIKMVSEAGFLASLKSYDKDSIAPKIIKKISEMTPDPDFQPERVEKVSKAAFGLAMWCRAMETYDRVAKQVAPKKEKLAEAEAEYAEVMVNLNRKREELKIVMDKLQALTEKLDGLKAEQEDLAYQVDLCEKKLVRAETLITSLGSEKDRWTINAKNLGDDLVNLTGDVLVSSGIIAYLGAFTPDFREDAVINWATLSREKGIPGSPQFSLVNILGEPVKIRDWTIQGLPNDNFSIENSIIIATARRWPLAIDPQGQANKWIKKMESARDIVVRKFTDADYLRQLENAIQFGNPVMMENVGEELDPAIESILLKQTFKKGGITMIKLGDSLVEYGKTFFFYLTSKLRNPHYLPEVSVKVTLLNFMITAAGLQDQMLNLVVLKERPELAEEKARLVLEGAANKKELENTENEVLRVMSASKGNILEDEGAIGALKASKTISNKIEEKQLVAEEMEKEIDEARKGYVPVASQGSILFFCIADLANVDPMYQYSLPFFVSLFYKAMENSDTSHIFDQRIENINTFFMLALYRNICRSLFERHKLLFSFLLCIRVFMATGDVGMNDYRFLLTGGVSLEDPPPKAAAWIPERCWAEMFRLSKVCVEGSHNVKPAYNNLLDHFAREHEKFKDIYDSSDPLAILQDVDNRPRTVEFFSPFQLLLLLRCLRPDRVVPAVMIFVGDKLGRQFITPPPFDLPGSFNDSTSASPLLFVLSPGSDPAASLLKFAGEKSKEVAAISLGQGQGPKAEKMMTEAMKSGSWVFLQNCHLATSWMPHLEKMLDQMDPKTIHRDYRLWLSSYPSEQFPVMILQNGVKMTNEPPKGLRANLIGSYHTDPICNSDFFEKSLKPMEFKFLVFGLAFFHAVIQERRLFGPLGWNIPYEFTESDLRISVRQLQMFIDESPDFVPYKALLYLTGECNYGGRVTDDKDRRLIMTLLNDYFSPNIFENGHVFGGKEEYFTPPEGDWTSYITHIGELPIVTPPSIFGFHENANLTKEQGETYLMMDDLLLTMGAAAAGGGSGPEEAVGEVAADILARIKRPFDLVAVGEKYPVTYEESMNTVLVQELTRFNKLVKVIIESLKDIQKAIKGLVLMSTQLEAAFFSVFDGKTPAMWMAKSYPSLKPLGSYVNDLAERLRMFQTWIENGKPVIFWISGIYFTQAFTTGASQNYARKYTIPIDVLVFEFLFPKEQEPTETPGDGVYTVGTYLEGCRWGWDSWQLEESVPKVLFSPVPLTHIVPCKKTELKNYPLYNCPLYKISSRRGTLSTTGHSTNFVMTIRIPSELSESHWIKRGVAMLTQLDV
eukprot:GEMP01000572.1.p1 GENE.GEMP01000572.1~~GEMP01000572.1.p1  ORF type:complete len:1304 (+),score=347.90 GEMP01000572.1:1943-5854(+)